MAGTPPPPPLLCSLTTGTHSSHSYSSRENSTRTARAMPSRHGSSRVVRVCDRHLPDCKHRGQRFYVRARSASHDGAGGRPSAAPQLVQRRRAPRLWKTYRLRGARSAGFCPVFSRDLVGARGGSLGGERRATGKPPVWCAQPLPAFSLTEASATDALDERLARSRETGRTKNGSRVELRAR